MMTLGISTRANYTQQQQPNNTTAPSTLSNKPLIINKYGQQSMRKAASKHRKTQSLGSTAAIK